MNSAWVDAMEKRINEESPYHKCIPKSIRSRVICVTDGKRSKAIRLPDVPVSGTMIEQQDLQHTHDQAKQLYAGLTRLRECLLISFPGTHEEIVQCDMPDLVVTGLALGSPADVPESLPRFHSLTSLLLILEEYKPAFTRRYKQPRRLKLTRRVKPGSLKTRGIVLNT